MLQTFGFLRFKKVPFMAGLVLALALTFGTTLRADTVNAAACPPSNNIITGGFSTKQDLIDQIQHGDSSGHTDLAAIFAHFGLSSGDFSDFTNNAVEGVAMKNGDILVDGVKVGTNAGSFGRTQSCQGANPSSLNIGGTTLWGNVNSQNLANDSEPVWVLFDDSGSMKFAVMPSCGNPTTFTPVKSNFSCDLLVKHPVDNQPNTFTFTTNVTVSGFAKLARVEYDFGDGSPVVSEPDGNTPTPPHTFTKTSTVTSRVFVTFPGGKTASTTSPTCQTTITVTPPPTPTPPPAPTPTPPSVLPNTGAGNVIGLFVAIVTGGFLIHRWFLLRKDNSGAAE